jgi:rfaE bifunctional protein nucleotidyltransferase chain/domain
VAQGQTRANGETGASGPATIPRTPGGKASQTVGVVIDRELFRNLRDHLGPDDRVVLTHGCFDLLHTGHFRLLNYARSLGDLLVIGLNSDASVRELKGEGRPLVPQAERAQTLCAVWAVTFVIIYEELRADATIEAVRPDVYVRGGDYRPQDILEMPTVERLGARVEIMPLVEGRSTSRMAARFRHVVPPDGTCGDPSDAER